MTSIMFQTQGRAIINNFSHDEEVDTLFLNVSYSSINCSRERWDLRISFCESHSENWFSHGLESFRHIFITTADGVAIEPQRTNTSNASCMAISIDFSNSLVGQQVELKGSFEHVRQVIGSNFSDNIVGNENPNILNGGLAEVDYLEGNNGSDTYIIKEGSGLTTINNFTND